jgi:hypothetical protein
MMVHCGTVILVCMALHFGVPARTAPGTAVPIGRKRNAYGTPRQRSQDEA